MAGPAVNLWRPDEFVGTKRATQMYRWILIRCRFFQVVLHCHVLSDVPVLHDHEWWNVTLVLRGRGLEWIEYPTPEAIAGRAKKLFPGRVIFRRATDLHWLEIPKRSQLWTLFITGRKSREFGYRFPSGRWVHWKQATAIVDMQRFRK